MNSFGDGVGLQLLGGSTWRPGQEVPEEGAVGLYIGAVGFEPRCNHVFKVYRPAGDSCLILGFPDRHTGEFDVAWQEYRDGGAIPHVVADAEVSGAVRERLASLAASESVTSILLDVSSFSRLRTAIILEEISQYALQKRTVLTVLYSLPVYTEPASADGPLNVLEPVTPFFDGSLADPELPLVALVGVGYEGQRGLGIIEFLDASEAWVLVPLGYDVHFDGTMLAANDLLLKRAADRRIEYDPANPLALFRVLQSLTHALRTDYRVVMVPMGPKMLAACCMLISILSDGVDAVWRASSEIFEDPKPVDAAGAIASLRFRTGVGDS